MASSLYRSVRFKGIAGHIVSILLFLTIVAAVCFYMSPLGPAESGLLVEAFGANKALNGLIVIILIFGIIYNLRQVGAVCPAVRWVNAYQDGLRGKMPRPPGLITAMARMLFDEEGRKVPLNQSSTTAILDSVGSRIDEGREFGKYIANLLVFLGLLGTFWGLLQTVNAVAETINGLTGTGSAEDAVTQLITNLNEPLSGMGTAFSSSLFGLGGALVVGYLDIQAGQAQNRFYSDLEDWFSANVASLSGRDASTQSYLGGEVPSDILSALGSIEVGLQRLTEKQEHFEAQSTLGIREEIRQLGRTLTEGPQEQALLSSQPSQPSKPSKSPTSSRRNKG